MAKKGKTAKKADIKLPIKGCFLILWEYNQIKKIYTEKNRKARHETNNAIKATMKLSEK